MYSAWSLCDSFVVKTLGVLVALSKGHCDQIDNFLVEGDALEDVQEAFFQDFFTDESLRAFALVTGAVVVDVPVLFDLAYQGTAAVPTGDQARESEAVRDCSAFFFCPR